jgi:RNA polymerase sigma factor (sigma-70 family)
MQAKLVADWNVAEDDRSIVETFARERARLRALIRKRVPNPADVEDVLQELFYELIEAARFSRPVEQVSAWLFRVARNRIIDLFRKNKNERTESLDETTIEDGEAPESLFEQLPAATAGPEAAYAAGVLLDELAHALDELSEEQRSVFLAHEIDGRSFRELAELSGVSINTLLSRKRYAVMHLRRRLQAIHDEFIESGEFES